MWYKKNKDAKTEKAYFIMQKGNNTALITTVDRTMLAHTDQIREREEENESMEYTEGDEQLNIPGEDIVDEPVVYQPQASETIEENEIPSDDYSEDERRPRSPLSRTLTRIFRRSERSTKGIRPVRFREM